MRAPISLLCGGFSLVERRTFGPSPFSKAAHVISTSECSSPSLSDRDGCGAADLPDRFADLPGRCVAPRVVHYVWRARHPRRRGNATIRRLVRRACARLKPRIQCFRKNCMGCEQHYQTSALLSRASGLAAHEMRAYGLVRQTLAGAPDDLLRRSLTPSGQCALPRSFCLQDESQIP